MNKNELELIKKYDQETHRNIIDGIQQSYKSRTINKIAHNFTVFGYFFNFIFFIGLFQHMMALNYEGKKQYNKAMLWTLLGFNPMFFLYIGEQKHYRKHFNTSLENEKLSSNFQTLKKRKNEINQWNREKIEKIKDSKLSTLPFPKNKNYIELGIVSGSSVRSTNFTKDVSASVKGISGGRVESYSELNEQSRQDALNFLVKNAYIKYGEYHKIYNIRFESITLAAGKSEILVYGTVVNFLK